MSVETRLRRIKNLKSRIKYQDDFAAKCEGKSGYCCVVPAEKGYMSGLVTKLDVIPNCYNHSDVTQNEYKRLKKQLATIEKRHEKLGS